MTHRKGGGIDVVDARFLPQLRKKERRQGDQSPLLQDNESLVARHSRKITPEHFSHGTVIKILQVFEARTVQHEQQGDDLSVRQSRIRPARSSTVADEMTLKYILESFTKIIHFTENSQEPIQHSHVHYCLDPLTPEVKDH